MLSNTQLLIALLYFVFAFQPIGQAGAIAQTKDTTPETRIVSKDTIPTKKVYDPLKPARAAFYSASLPGLGQIYNKDYWKLPIVYGALGTGIFVAVDSNQEFRRFRTAFKQRLAGRIDEFTEVDPITGETTQVFTNDALIRGQNIYRRRKELAILVTAGIYVLQIIEANVDAHLSQYDVSDDLTFAPDMHIDDLGIARHYGFRLTYNIIK